nr:dihydrolipoyl dehydrogenase, mitochondrial [Ipomoea trifida]
MAMANIARRSRNLYYNSSKYALSLSRGFASGSEENDVVVIGGGPGGYVAAIKAAQLGLKTICIQKRGTLGGTCLNVGCIPSKALLHSSHMYDEATRSFAKHGVKCSSVELDLPAMMAQKDEVVSDLTKGIEGLFKKNKVNYVKGYGKFLSPSEITVDTIDGGETVVKGKSIIIATGSDVKGLPGITIDEERIVSSTGALALKEVPKKLLVIGAGYIGLEIGCVWADLVQRSLLLNLHLILFLAWMVVSVDSSGDGVKLTLEPAAGGDQTVLEADVVLVSAGRTPFTAGLQLDKIGVETDKIGRILVNGRFATTVPGVYAIGDVIPGPMLAHKAMKDGVSCVECIAGKEGHLDYDMCPAVVYTHPEVASVGKTEEQVKALGVSYRVGKFPFMANGRAKAIGDAEGLVKILVEKETDKILGAHIMASNGGELIHEVMLGGSSEDLALKWHAHPTMIEAVKEAALATYDKPMHI